MLCIRLQAVALQLQLWIVLPDVVKVPYSHAGAAGTKHKLVPACRHVGVPDALHQAGGSVQLVPQARASPILHMHLMCQDEAAHPPAGDESAGGSAISQAGAPSASLRHRATGQVMMMQVPI